MNMNPVDHLWPVLRPMMGMHAKIYKATGGRIGHRIPGVPPTLLLDHVGAKSGTPRTSPLTYLGDGEDLVLVASKGGNPRHPAWFHNLKANPETTVQVGSRRRPVRARVASAGEREQLWPRVVRQYGGYENYQQRTEREIPLVILEPR
jgi:deazaflavin-dependent oxidoreductase (nitroreductase family)